MARLDPERTQAVVSTAQVPTGRHGGRRRPGGLPRPRDPRADGWRSARTSAVYLDAEAVALATFGSQPAANLVVVGVAYQRGLLPQSASAIERAIELNGVAVETNTAAFRLGREIAIDPTRAATEPRVAPPASAAEAAAFVRTRRRRTPRSPRSSPGGCPS